MASAHCVRSCEELSASTTFWYGTRPCAATTAAVPTTTSTSAAPPKRALASATPLVSRLAQASPRRGRAACSIAMASPSWLTEEARTLLERGPQHQSSPGLLRRPVRRERLPGKVLFEDLRVRAALQQFVERLVDGGEQRLVVGRDGQRVLLAGVDLLHDLEIGLRLDRVLR